MSLADSVQELEDQLAEALERVDELETLTLPFAHDLAAEALEDLREAIEDLRRGIITLDELYERAVGR